MIATPGQRLIAAAIDCAVMVAWSVIVAGTLALAAGAGWLPRGVLGLHLVFLTLVVVPVTAALTVMEAGRYEATPGKGRVGLRLRRDPSGDRVGWGRSFARNVMKLGLPWALLQSAVLAVVAAPSPAAIAGLVFAVAVPLAFLISLFSRDGRTIYDWLTGTQVIHVCAGRRFAADPEGDSAVAEPTGEPGQVGSPSI